VPAVLRLERGRAVEEDGDAAGHDAVDGRAAREGVPARLQAEARGGEEGDELPRRPAGDAALEAVAAVQHPAPAAPRRGVAHVEDAVADGQLPLHTPRAGEREQERPRRAPRARLPRGHLAGR